MVMGSQQDIHMPEAHVDMLDRRIDMLRTYHVHSLGYESKAQVLCR